MPHVSAVTYIVGESLPDLWLWWVDSSGVLIDFSSGWSFAVEIGQPTEPAVVTKTANIIGAAGSGTPRDGTPNLVVAWDPDEFAPLSRGRWTIEITATRTADLKVRKRHIPLLVRSEVVSATP